MKKKTKKNKKSISLTVEQIARLEMLYSKGEDLEYDDLTPNLKAYADWVMRNESLTRELARTKFAWWGGWNALMTALDYMDKKIDKAPRLACSSKNGVDENNFIGYIHEKVFDGKWN